ncbi:MAG: macro domain-containing protein [Candidatus Limousia pullorum]
MSLRIIQGDITKLNVDAIVNAAKSSLMGGGGVDGCIHRAAGKGLLGECSKLGGCPTGESKTTGAYNLPCKYVIHTVGPVCNGGDWGEQRLLESCYNCSLIEALRHSCKAVAFPLISAGAYGYPKEEALKVAVDSIVTFQSYDKLQVLLVLFDIDTYKLAVDMFPQYI